MTTYIPLKEEEFSSIFKFLECYAKTWKLAAMIHEYSWRSETKEHGKYFICFADAWEQASAITGYFNFNDGIKNLVQSTIQLSEWNDKLEWSENYLVNNVVGK